VLWLDSYPLFALSLKAGETVTHYSSPTVCLMSLPPSKLLNWEKKEAAQVDADSPLPTASLLAQNRTAAA